MCVDRFCGIVSFFFVISFRFESRVSRDRCQMTRRGLRFWS